MKSALTKHLLLVLALLLIAAMPLSSTAQTTKPYQYIRAGNAADVKAITTGGFALMGGGHDLDQAFQWMCARSGGGDFLILRANGTDAYNPYVQGICKQNSVATLILPTRASAEDPAVAAIIAKAEAIFIAGGDQADYINFWKGTPVQKAINDAVHRGVPIGGTSAGLAIQGEYIYSSQNDVPDGPDLNSKGALADPFHHQIVIVHGFVDNPLLAKTITDTHFVTRDRLGRLLVMLARILEKENVKSIRGIGIDERTSVLLEPNGQGTVAGAGAAYFLRVSKKATLLTVGKPITFGPIAAVKLTAGQTFDVKTWRGQGIPFVYTIQDGVIHSTLPGGSKF